MDDNPYQSPLSGDAQGQGPPDQQRGQIAKAAGNVVAIAGLVALAYGAVGFWLIPGLPPNNPTSGRLPSIYFLGAGILATLIGLAMRDLRLGGRSKAGEGTTKGIPAATAILILLAMVVAAIVVISRL